MSTLQHHIAQWMGLTNAAGTVYSFWSGIGSDFGEVTLFAGLALAYHHLACHEPVCRRAGRYLVVDADGSHHRTCRKHHIVHGDGSGQLAAHVAKVNARARVERRVDAAPSKLPPVAPTATSTGIDPGRTRP